MVEFTVEWFLKIHITPRTKILDGYIQHRDQFEAVVFMRSEFSGFRVHDLLARKFFEREFTGQSNAFGIGQSNTLVTFTPTALRFMGSPEMETIIAMHLL